MLLASSMGKEFSPPSAAGKSNDWSKAVSSPGAWFLSWKPPSAPSRAASAKFALLGARRPMPCCWLLTGQELPLATESPWFPEHASFANPYPLRKRLFRRHDASFVQKEVSGPFREQAQTGVGENYQAGLASADASRMKLPGRLRKNTASWPLRIPFTDALSVLSASPPRKSIGCLSRLSFQARNSSGSTTSLILSRNSTIPFAPSFWKRCREKAESMLSAKNSGVVSAPWLRSSALS